MKFLRNRNPVVDVLTVLFGIGSWIAVNGMWSELSLLVAELPESWTLSSYISLIVQIANIVPLIYGILKKFFPDRIKSAIVIHVMMAIGTIACFLLPFFWNVQTVILGEPHSVAFFVLLFFISIVDCSSSVLFFPFLGIFKSVYMSSFLVGESFSGLVPSLLALGQGAGSTLCVNVSTDSGGWKMTQEYLTPNFSFEIFCFVLCAMMAVSWISFAILNHSPMAKNEQITTKEIRTASLILEKSQNDETTSLISSPKKSSKFLIKTFIFIQFWLSILDKGIMTSLQTYSSLPYGNDTFHLTVNLTMLASPTVCIIAMFVKLPKKKAIFASAVVATALAAYIISTAAMSPTPPLHKSDAGKAIIVIAWVMKSATMSFVKVCIANVMRSEGVRALFYFGAALQLGPALGSVISFLLVAVFHVFESADPCAL